MEPRSEADNRSSRGKRLQFSLFALLLFTTATAIVLTLVLNYPRLAIAIAVSIASGTALYLSDHLLWLANTRAWAWLTWSVWAALGSVLLVFCIVCHTTYGLVELKSGAEVWLLSGTLGIGGMICWYGAWKRWPGEFW